MPSSIGHALAAVAIGGAFVPRGANRRFWIAGVLCAVFLDVDAIGRPFGRGDLAFLGGHRAFTHSLLFAVLLGTGVAWTAFRAARWDPYRIRIALFLILATASHGALDAFASYGEGVAFLLPFSDVRYASPWRPLKALNEIWWIWVPAMIAILMAWQVRRLRRQTCP